MVGILLFPYSKKKAVAQTFLPLLLALSTDLVPAGPQSSWDCEVMSQKITGKMLGLNSRCHYVLTF